MLILQTVKNFSKTSSMLKKAFLLLLMTSVSNGAFAQTSTADDSKLIEQFIQSKGYSEIIVFDASNIKQFWTDKTVFSRDGLIHVSLNKNDNPTLESVPLRIQLANVKETQDCKIDIITDNSDVSFTVFNANGIRISESPKEEKFVNYNILSNSFQLADTEDFSFNLLFHSILTDVSIKKIVMSFSPNKNSAFTGSPGFEQLIKEYEEKGVDADGLIDALTFGQAVNVSSAASAISGHITPHYSPDYLSPFTITGNGSGAGYQVIFGWNKSHLFPKRAPGLKYLFIVDVCNTGSELGLAGGAKQIVLGGVGMTTIPSVMNKAPGTAGNTTYTRLAIIFDGADTTFPYLVWTLPSANTADVKIAIKNWRQYEVTNLSDEAIRFLASSDTNPNPDDLFRAWRRWKRRNADTPSDTATTPPHSSGAIQ